MPAATLRQARWSGKRNSSERNPQRDSRRTTCSWSRSPLPLRKSIPMHGCTSLSEKSHLSDALRAKDLSNIRPKASCSGTKRRKSQKIPIKGHESNIFWQCRRKLFALSLVVISPYDPSSSVEKPAVGPKAAPPTPKVAQDSSGKPEETRGITTKTDDLKSKLRSRYWHTIENTGDRLVPTRQRVSKILRHSTDMQRAMDPDRPVRFDAFTSRAKEE